MEQVRSLLSFLEGQGIDFFVDSGSLLGIVREGRLFQSDPDIDVSVIQNEKVNLEALIQGLSTLGYDISFKSYAGNPQVIWLKPKPGADRSWTRPVDLRLFTLQGRYLYSAQHDEVMSGWNAGNRGLVSFGLAVRRQLGALAYKFWPRLSADSAMMQFLRPIKVFRCWRIPHDLVRETIIFEGHYRIPARYDEYLTLRYGQWQIPNHDWDYKTQDPTLVPKAKIDLMKHDLGSNTPA